MAKVAAAPAKPDIKKLAASAREIIASEDVLALFAKTIGRQIVGEEKNTKTLLLAATSRLLDETMHVAVKGPSAGGKSEIRKRVLDFMPPEDVIPFTALSERRCSTCLTASSTKSCPWAKPSPVSSKSSRTCCCAS